MFKRVIVLFLVGLVGFCAACATLQDVRQAQAPAERLFECTAKAFAPIAGSYERGADLVKQIQVGAITASDALDAAQATAGEAKALADALKACTDEAKAAFAVDAPDAGPDAAE